MVTWDAGLPQKFLIDGFEQQYPDNRLRSENDAGPAKIRRRSSLNVSGIKGSMVMTMAQIAILDTFVNTTLASGILPFNFPDPDNYGSTIEVRFGGSLPVKARSGSQMLVTMEFEVLP